MVDGDLAADTLDFKKVEARIGRPFSAALIDCEGCVLNVLQSGLISQLSLVLIEEDGDLRRQQYERVVHRALRENGFARVWRSHDTADPSAVWSQTIEHSAWVRELPPPRGTNGAAARGRMRSFVESNDLCRKTRIARGYTKDMLFCYNDTRVTPAMMA